MLAKEKHLEEIADTWYSLNRDIIFILKGIDIDQLPETDNRVSIEEVGDMQVMRFDGIDISSLTMEQQGNTIKVLVVVSEEVVKNEDVKFFLEDSASRYEI